MNKLWDILAKAFNEDDEKRDNVNYDLYYTIEKTITKIKKLKIKDFENEN